MPTPADDVAVGPAQIAARLRLGLEPLAGISHDIRAIVSEGDTVVTEHVEHWEWPTGERASLPFVSMQEVRDGKIVRWWDYWDLATLMNTAPAWWVEHIMTEAAQRPKRCRNRGGNVGNGQRGLSRTNRIADARGHRASPRDHVVDGGARGRRLVRPARRRDERRRARARCSRTTATKRRNTRR